MAINANLGLDLINSSSLGRAAKSDVVANNIIIPNTKSCAIVVDGATTIGDTPVASSNIYQPQEMPDVAMLSPDVLDGLLTKFEQFKTELAPANNNPIYDNNTESNDTTTIAMIMWILQDLLPKLMLIMNKLNMSLTELSANNFALEVANAKIAFEYSKESNKQTKLAAMQSFTAEIVGASVDATSGMASLINTVKHNQTPVEAYNDKKNSLDSLQEKNSLLSSTLGAKNDVESNPQILKSLLTSDEKNKIDDKVTKSQEELTKLNEVNKDKLRSIDRHNLTGVKAEQNLVDDIKNIGDVENSNIIDIAKKIKIKASTPPLSYKDIENNTPKLTKSQIINHDALEKIANGYGAKDGDILSKPIIILDNGQTLAMIPDAPDRIGLYLISKDGSKNNPNDTFVRQATVQLSDHLALINAFTSGKIYNTAELGQLKGLISKIDQNTLTDDSKRQLTNVNDYIDKLHTIEDSGLFKNNRINILSDGKVYELPNDFDTTGQVNVRCLNKDGNALEDYCSVIIPNEHRATFKTEYNKAQAFTLDNIESHIGDAKLIVAYVNSNRSNNKSDFVGKLEAKIPALAEKATLAQVELDINKDYIDSAHKYLNDISGPVDTISKKIEYRRVLAESFIKMTTAASKMGTSGVTLDAKNQEADARLLESFAQVMDRVIGLMSKTTNSYTDDFAKFLKDLRDAIIQQLVASSQLLTRFYGTR